jgi:deoxyribonuclease-4
MISRDTGAHVVDKRRNWETRVEMMIFKRPSNELSTYDLNDSMNFIGSHKDRHEKIGQGNIGLNAIGGIINHPSLRNLPFYLETPNDVQGYAREILLLKGLYQEDCEKAGDDSGEETS